MTFDTEGASWPIVILRVGQERKVLLAHKHVLTKATIFASCLAEGRFQEGANNEINFPEDGLEEMVAILRYLYTGEVSKWEDDWTEHDRAYPRDISDVIRAYAIADKYCIEGMCQMVFDMIDVYFPVSQISYSHLAQMKKAGLQESRLRNLLFRRIIRGLRHCSHHADLLQMLQDGLESDNDIAMELLERLAVDLAEGKARGQISGLTFG